MRALILFSVTILSTYLPTSVSAQSPNAADVARAGRVSNPSAARGPGTALQQQSRTDARSQALSRAAAAGSQRSSVGTSRRPTTPQTGTGRTGKLPRTGRRDSDAVRAAGRSLDRRPSSRIPERAAETRRGQSRRDVVSAGQNRFARTESDRLLQNRLSEIDRMRDNALDTNNPQLLQQADRLEQLARQQYEQRETGDSIDAASIFRPADAGTAQNNGERRPDNGQIIRTSATATDRTRPTRKPNFLKRIVSGTAEATGNLFRAIIPRRRKTID